MTRPTRPELSAPAAAKAPAAKAVGDTVIVSGVSNSETEELAVVVQDWTKAEERKAKAKFVYLSFFCFLVTLICS